MSVVRHTPGSFSQANVDALSASPSDWITRGSALFESARFVRDSVTTTAPTIIQYFGTENMAGPGGEYDVPRLHGVAGMLFGMACECWCKSLWLFSLIEANRLPVSKSKCFLVHDLKELLVHAGVTPFLCKDDNEYAELLSSLVLGMGRFAGPSKLKHLIPWVDQAVDHARWQSLQEAIGKRRDELGVG
jgi:hypothetical protein